MKYVIGALVVLALLFLVWWMVSRGKQQKLEEQRAEAASLRAGAEGRAATIRGQETFAQHADERAAVARQEAEERARQAEESAREAQRVEAEARAHQSELERARLSRDAELRRADEIDPDVEVDKTDPRPLPEDLDDHVRPLDEAQRLASGVDYRDDDEWVSGERRSHDDAAFAESGTAGTTGRRDRSDDATGDQGDADMVVINDVEDYASTEPLPMEEQAPVERTDDASGFDGTHEDQHDLDTTAGRDVGTGSVRVSDEDLMGSGDDAASPSEGGDATHWPDGTDRGSEGDGYDSGAGRRRISELDEIRDGGFGVGSAAPLEDRAQPFDHPVQAYRDTMTYRTPGASGYDSAEPDVWFYDEDAARRAGFTPSEG
jgi:hypothetical protein